MNEVLADIGRGLPANLDFDVREAKRGTPVSEMPEAQLLLDHSREVLRAAAETSGAMDNKTLEVWRSLETPSSSAATGPINLVDDEDMEGGGGTELFIAPALIGGIPSNPPVAMASTSNSPLRDLVDIEDSDGPRVFEFLGTTMLLPRDAEQAPMEVPPTTLLCPVVAEMAPSPLPSFRELTAKQHVEERPVLQATVERQGAEKLGVASVNVPEITNRAQATGGDLLQVGKSAFYFLDPTFKLPAESIAADMGLAPNQLVHLWPGAVRQTVRWDALGEIDLNYPLFAETWARWAFPDCASAVNVADAALQLRAGAAGLRELGIQMATDATVHNALAALRLVNPGEAFVDWQSTDDMGDGVPEQEVFTVREVMLSHVPRLFVVHIDALDGAFVQWIIGLLRQVINGYSNSGWVSRQMLEEPATPAQAETPATQSTTLNQEVTALVGGLLEKLRELGIDVTPGMTER